MGLRSCAGVASACVGIASLCAEKRPFPSTHRIPVRDHRRHARLPRHQCRRRPARRAVLAGRPAVAARGGGRGGGAVRRAGAEGVAVAPAGVGGRAVPLGVVHLPAGLLAICHRRGLLRARGAADAAAAQPPRHPRPVRHRARRRGDLHPLDGRPAGGRGRPPRRRAPSMHAIDPLHLRADLVRVRAVLRRHRRQRTRDGPPVPHPQGGHHPFQHLPRPGAEARRHPVAGAWSTSPRRSCARAGASR